MKVILFAVALLVSTVTTAEEIVFKTVDDIKKCGQKNSWDTGVCFEAFEKFVDKNPKQALAAAKIGRTVFAQWAVLPTFDKAYTKTKDVGICKDNDFQLSLFNALGQSETSDAYKLAQKFLKGECGPHLVEMATKELDSYAGSAVIENLCPLLKANGKTHTNCEPKPVAKEPEPVKETLPKLDKSKIKLGQVKAYRGPEGVQVVVAEVQGEKGAFLVRFSGIKGPWNNKTLIHKTNQVNSNGSMDYWTEHKGESWNSIVIRNCYSGYCQTELYAPETGFSGGIAISYDEKESKKIKSKDLISTL